METQNLEIREKNNFIEIFGNILEKAATLDADIVYFGEDGAPVVSFIKDGEVFYKIFIPNPQAAERLTTMAALHAGLIPRNESSSALVGIADYVVENIGESAESADNNNIDGKRRRTNNRRTDKQSGIFSHPNIPNIIFQSEQAGGTAQNPEHKIYLWKSRKF